MILPNICAMPTELSISGKKKLLVAYGEELQMTISLDAPQKSLEALATDLNAATDRIQKRIVVFELMGLALVDGTYADEEKAFFKLLGEKLDLRPTFTERCEASIREYMAVQKEIDEVILGGITIHPHSGWFFHFRA